MKKLNFWLLVSLFVAAFTVVACGDDEEPLGPDSNNNTSTDSTANPKDSIGSPTDSTTTPTDSTNIPPVENKLLGTWSYKGVTYTFTNDEVEIKVNDETIFYNAFDFKGAYTYNNGILRYSYGDNKAVMKVEFAYGEQVLVMKAVPDNADDYSLGETAIWLFKNGIAPNTPVSDTQGQWFWYFQDDSTDVRAAVKISGNEIDLVVCPWGKRYVGTFTYAGGEMNVDWKGLYSGNEDFQNPQNSTWMKEDAETADSYFENFGSWIPFLVNAQSREAYSVMANLPCIFKKSNTQTTR
ncbi:MAG: hypothetical protein J5671_00365 [Bacteroidaceae bacterium]|nr:hypothetical protein [Bacteroidaceae bacterium]